MHTRTVSSMQKYEPTRPSETLVKATPLQRYIWNQALTCVSIAAILGVFLIVILGIQIFLTKYKVVILPLALAGLVALLLKPLIRYLYERLKIPLTVTIAVLYVISTSFVFLVVFKMIPLLIEEVTALVSMLPVILQRLQDKLLSSYPHIYEIIQSQMNFAAISEHIFNYKNRIATFGQYLFPKVDTIKSSFLSIGALVGGSILFPIYLYYMLTFKGNIASMLQHQLAFLPKQWVQSMHEFITQFSSILAAFFRGQLMIATILGCYLSIGFWALQIPFSWVLGLTIGWINVVPYLGTGLGCLIIYPVALFYVDHTLIASVGVTLLFITNHIIEGYCLTPLILGKRFGLHPMVIILSILFWGTAFSSIWGMMFAIPLTAFMIVIGKAVRAALISKTLQLQNK